MQNVSEEFKEAIKAPARELKSKIELPGLELNDENISKIDIDSSLVFGEDFEVGTAPMDTAKVELVVDDGDYGRNLILNSDKVVNLTDSEVIKTTVDYYDEFERLDYKYGRNLFLNSRFINGIDNWYGSIVKAENNTGELRAGNTYQRIIVDKGTTIYFRVNLYLPNLNAYWGLRQNGIRVSDVPNLQLPNTDFELYSSIVTANSNANQMGLYVNSSSAYVNDMFALKTTNEGTDLEELDKMPYSPASEDLSNLKGVKYNLSTPLKKDQYYTLSVDGTFNEDDFIGIWLGNNKFIGYLDDDNKITFKSNINIDDNYIIVKSLNEEGTINTINLVEGKMGLPWKEAPEDILDYDYEDRESNIKLGIRLPDKFIEYAGMGLYTIEKAIKKDNKITLDCVDRMYKAEIDFVNNLEFPTTILNILQSACEQCNIELATTNFANADYVVPNEPVFENITCRHIFAQVAELAGGYAKINREGKLEILTLSNKVEREITKDNYFTFEIDEVAIGKIDKVIVKVGDEKAEQGEGENIYTIVDNMFVQDPNNVVGPIFNVLKDVNYTACDVNFQGDFSLDLGDRVTIDNHETNILDRKLKYTGGFREDYKAPAKSNVEKNSTGKSNILLDINNIKTQIKVIDGEISQTIEKIEGEIKNEVAEHLKDAEIYTWIKYADDKFGNGISDNPAEKKYVGIASNKKNVEPSNNPSDYTWSRIQGQDGVDGKGVKSTIVTYRIGSSGTTVPTGPWSETIPNPVKGQYLWTRTVTAYTDNSTVTTYSVSYYPTDGQKGEKGDDGGKGQDGIGIKSTEIRYQNHINGTTAPSGTWSSAVPTPVKGRYLWTRTIIIYTDNSTSTSYSTSYYATDGQKGDKGDSTYTWIKYADDKFGNGMSDSSEDKRYVGIASNKSSPNKSNNSQDYEWSPLYDNVEIGAENRLFDSQINIELYSNDDLDIQLIRGPGNPYYKVYNPHGNTIDLFAAFPNSRFAEPLETLGRVTISLEVMVDIDRDVAINGATFPVKGNRWTKIYFSKTFTENDNEGIRFLVPYSRKRRIVQNINTKLIDSLTTNINTLYYRNIQVERGNVPTDHNLAPEELEGEITRVRTDIKQIVDSISLISIRNENTGKLEVTPESIVQAIDTTDGVGKVKTVKVIVDEDGLTVDDGAIVIRDSRNTAIITSNGLKITYMFTSSGQLHGWQPLTPDVTTLSIGKQMATINARVPEKILITKATLITKSMPFYLTGWDGIPTGYYHARNLSLYHGFNEVDGFVEAPYVGDWYVQFGNEGSTNISDTVWDGRWTPSGSEIQTKTADVTQYVESGVDNVFTIPISDSTSSANRRYRSAIQFDLIVEGYLRG